ncbi:MAG: ATP-binding protein [Candidatus Margulisiibacteriota bacterium]
MIISDDLLKFLHFFLRAIFALVLVLIIASASIIERGKFFLAVFVFLVNWGTGLLVLMHDRKKPLNWSFFLLTFFVGVWGFCLSAFRATAVVMWGKATFFFASFIPATFFSFVKLFPTQEEKYGAIDLLFYLLAGAIAVLSLTDFIIDGVAYLSWGVDLVLGPGHPIFAGYFLGVVFFGFVKLFSKYRKSSGTVRNQIRYLFLGTFLTAIIGSLVAIIFPIFNFSNLYYLAPPSTFIMIAAIAYALIKHHLMDVSIVISRVLAEVLAVLFLGVIYLGLVWFYRSYVSALIDWPFLVWTVIYGILVGQVYQRIRIFIQTTSDKVFLRGKYDYYRELAKATAQITKTLSTENILETLRRIFYEIIEVSNPRIYLSGDFDKPEVKQFLAVKELTFLGEDLVIPCLLEGRPIAIIVLGKKLSEDEYTTEDLQLLQTLASQTAVAIDHTRTYEEIKRDFEANQKKLYETERLLARSERIASLANLIREYNHEIKTPLAIIRNELALMPDDPELVSFKGKMIKAMNRIKDIVENTLRLSDVSRREKIEVNINEIIEESLTLFPPSGVRVVKELGVLPKMLGDPEDLKMVFMNLIKNAVEAMPQGGELKIKSYPLIEEGHTRIMVEVSDTGVGIPAENLDKIFEPFFSTHVTKGRGLGLSIVFRIVREHGGEIKVESQLGKGTTFRLVFPLTALLSSSPR